MRLSMSRPPDSADHTQEPSTQPDWYFENGLLVYTVVCLGIAIWRAISE